jgi:hypothetical protein
LVSLQFQPVAPVWQRPRGLRQQECHSLKAEPKAPSQRLAAAKVAAQSKFARRSGQERKE